VIINNLCSEKIILNFITGILLFIWENNKNMYLIIQKLIYEKSFEILKDK